jgi:hypothetical protein
LFLDGLFLFKGITDQTHEHQMVGRLLHYELKVCEEWSQPILRYYQVICLDGLWKGIKILRTACPNSEFNKATLNKNSFHTIHLAWYSITEQSKSKVIRYCEALSMPHGIIATIIFTVI